MAEYLTNTADLTAVADAIRAKGGTSAPLVYPSGFVSAIQTIDVATAGGITSFPTIEEVKANWTAVNLTDPVGDDIQFTSSIIFAFIIGLTDDSIAFLEVKQDQDFEFCSLCNENSMVHVCDLYLARGAIHYLIMASNVLDGQVIPEGTIQSVIYYTTADNFFSK